MGGFGVPQSEEMRAAGPSIGPIHSGVIPPPDELRKGVPASAMLSPLAITLRGLRKAPYKMKAVSQIVIHMTSRGPVNRSKKNGYRKPAITYALDHYLNGREGFPHYVVDFNGTIYATCDERYIAYHAGWVHQGGAELFRKSDWRAPVWWKGVWSRFGLKSPIDLLPKGAAGPNARSIGIELLISPKLTYTDQQYRALARLVVDIERRHGLAIPRAPCPTLLGHEDYAPVLGKGGRSDSRGGWDPGAHRTKPFFSWSKLWSYMRGSGATSTFRESAPARLLKQPPSNPAAYRKFRLTTYHVADQRELPTGGVRVPIYDDRRRRIAEASPAFFAHLSLEGTGRLTDGRLVKVTSKTVPVSHADFAGVLAYHRQAYAKGDRKRRQAGKSPAPTSYSGIFVEGGLVTRALAFHEVPTAQMGAGYGVQRGIPYVPFRTLAADIGTPKYRKVDPDWKGKGGLVPPRTRVYIREYDGLRLPDGSTHDGWFIVNDTGGAIFGAHFDVFVGTRALRKQVNLPAFGTVWFDGIEYRIPPGYQYGLKK